MTRIVKTVFFILILFVSQQLYVEYSYSIDGQQNYFTNREKRYKLVEPIEKKVKISRHQNRFWKKKYILLLHDLAGVQPDETDPVDDIYKKPESYNLVLIIYDKVPPSKDYKNYCKIYINNLLIGKTKESLSKNKKVIKIKLKENTKYILLVEKHFYNEGKKKWERLRNLSQPKKISFTITKDRIRVIQIIYDASKEKPSFEKWKYQYKSHYMRKNEDY